MKPGDLVRILYPSVLVTHDISISNKLGIIVDMSAVINNRPKWNVLINNTLHAVREIHLELVSEAR